jgi:hypothetical protein
MSLIFLPQMLTPDGQETAVVLKVALVHATTHQPVFGFQGELLGYAGESTFTLDGSSDDLELPANSDLVPGSQWRFTLEAGTQVEVFYVDLAAEVEVALVDLLYGASS